MAMMVFAWFRFAWEMPVLEEMSRSGRAVLFLGLTMLITFVATELALSWRNLSSLLMPGRVLSC